MVLVAVHDPIDLSNVMGRALRRSRQCWLSRRSANIGARAASSRRYLPAGWLFLGGRVPFGYGLPKPAEAING